MPPAPTPGPSAPVFKGWQHRPLRPPPSARPPSARPVFTFVPRPVRPPGEPLPVAAPQRGAHAAR
eukprot:6899694-Prymnesium_polylepis.1